MTETSNKSSAYDAIKWVLIVQSVVSAVLAIGIVFGSVWMVLGLESASEKQEEISETILSWGGVIIGFYFGTAFSQISSLLRALESNQPEPIAAESLPKADV